MSKEKTKAVPNTKLVGKEYSPLIMRRYSLPILTFVALITDDNLNDLDDVVNGYYNSRELPNSIQGMRDVAGILSEVLIAKYPKTEGVAVIIQADKCTISSLAGDFMNATPNRIELYALLNFATNV